MINVPGGNSASCANHAHKENEGPKCDIISSWRRFLKMPNCFLFSFYSNSKKKRKNHNDLKRELVLR
jgi:hypothetical protein